VLCTPVSEKEIPPSPTTPPSQRFLSCMQLNARKVGIGFLLTYSHKEAT
jgi:hypothetical protein